MILNLQALTHKITLIYALMCAGLKPKLVRAIGYKMAP